MIIKEENKKVLQPSFKHLNVSKEFKSEDLQRGKNMMAKCVCFCDNVKQFPVKVAAIAVWHKF